MLQVATSPNIAVALTAEGELQALENGWREAEEIARIADSLACRHASKNRSRVTAVNSEEAIKSRLSAE